ncbi:hypothetical protein FF021_09465 [Leptospira noguchii]|nr:hypothetical protein FF021_09465 [Leptospira noguchii]
MHLYTSQIVYTKIYTCQGILLRIVKKYNQFIAISSNDKGFSTFAFLERAKRAEELERGSRRLSAVSRTEVTKRMCRRPSESCEAISKRSEKPQLAEVWRLKFRDFFF